MNSLTKTGRVLYCIYLICIAVQQFHFADFKPILVSPWPAWLHQSPVWADLAGVGLLVAAAGILFTKWAKATALILGTSLLILFLGSHVPFQLFISPNDVNLASWTDALEELALAGGAFIIAGSYSGNSEDPAQRSRITEGLEKGIPVGRIFFSAMFIAFGIDHITYAAFISKMVPSWIPGPVFWTYFAAVALIGAGVAIIFKIRLRLVSLLLAAMLFLWVIMLHLPRAIGDPHTNMGNEVTSLFDALGFCGVALVLAYSPRENKKARV